MKIQIIIAVLLIATFRFAIAQSGAKSNDIEKLEQLKLNPICNYHAAYWFAQLPFDKKKYYSEKLGKIILVTADSSAFVIAFGANKSPFPWVFIIDNRSIELTANNTFTSKKRNDNNEDNQKGVYWTFEPYETKINNTISVFIKKMQKGHQWSDLWIPGTSWQYVGPEL